MRDFDNTDSTVNPTEEGDLLVDDATDENEAEEAEGSDVDENDQPDDAEAAEGDADENDETPEEAEEAAPDTQEVFDKALDEIIGDNPVDAAEFAVAFLAGGAKQPHAELNALVVETTLSVSTSGEHDPVETGRIVTALALFSEAAKALLPEKVSKGTAVENPADAAHEKVVRLTAMIEQIDVARENVQDQLEQQAILAGLITADDLDKLVDENGDPAIFVADVDTSEVTFTKKYGASIEYVTTLGSGARSSTGESAGRKFVAGETRYDKDGNAIRYDGTHYFLTLKGENEMDEKFTSSSTPAKKHITRCETSGPRHFSHDSDPTES